MKSRIFYHATWVGNVPSIEREGFRSRTQADADRIVDGVLAEYGLTRTDLPLWRWQYAHKRLLETAGWVYFSGDPMFALQNCLAGFEGELELRKYAYSFKLHKKSAGSWDYKMVPALRTNQNCTVFMVKIYEDEWEPKQHYLDHWAYSVSDESKAEHGWKTFDDYLDWVMSQHSEIKVKGGVPSDRIVGKVYTGPNPAHTLISYADVKVQVMTGIKQAWEREPALMVRERPKCECWQKHYPEAKLIHLGAQDDIGTFNELYRCPKCGQEWKHIYMSGPNNTNDLVDRIPQ